MARGRKAIEISPAEFQEVINRIEANDKPTTRSQLWKLVEETEWAKTRQPRALTAQVAMIKATKLGIQFLTPKGERGRQKGQGLPEQAREALRGPRKRRTAPPAIIAQWKRECPPSLHNAIDKAGGGDIREAVKVKCFDCSGGQKKEVTLCPSTDCPLHAFRPWQGKKSVAEAKAADAKELVLINTEE